MKKIMLILLLVTGCATEKPLIDEDQLKNDLNEAAIEFQTMIGVPEEDMYRIK